MNKQYVNMSEEYACPVCLEPVICPFTFGCGHTVDARCFFQLRKKECPQCRFKLHKTSKYSVNLMLQSFLANTIPNYEQLKESHLRFIKAMNVLKAYKASERYRVMIKLIASYVDGSAVKAVELSALMAHMESYDPLEVQHALDNNKCYRLDLDEVTYVIYRPDSDDIGQVLTQFGGRLSDHELLKYVCWTTSTTNDLEENGYSLHRLTFLEGRDEQLVEYLLGLSSDALTAAKKRRSGWESQSGSESGSEIEIESESESESQSESQSDDGITTIVQIEHIS